MKRFFSALVVLGGVLCLASALAIHGVPCPWFPTRGEAKGGKGDAVRRSFPHPPSPESDQPVDSLPASIGTEATIPRDITPDLPATVTFRPVGRELDRLRGVLAGKTVGRALLTFHGLRALKADGVWALTVFAGRPEATSGTPPRPPHWCGTLSVVGPLYSDVSADVTGVLRGLARSGKIRVEAVPITVTLATGGPGAKGQSVSVERVTLRVED